MVLRVDPPRWRLKGGMDVRRDATLASKSWNGTPRRRLKRWNGLVEPPRWRLKNCE